MGDGKKTLWFGLLILTAPAIVVVFFGCRERPVELRGQFPTRPIKVYVGFEPGGGTDLVARTIAIVLPEYLGQPVIVINKPGASGTIAAREVARAEPDGYTLLVAGGSETTSVGHFKKLPYHPIDDFTPIVRIARARMVLNVNAQSSWKTLEDFVDDARNNPGEYKYASAGHGSLYHCAMITFCKRAGIKMKHVPYKGGAPSMAALMGGHVDVAVASPAEASSLVEGGKIRSLALTSSERTPLQPDVPTLKELGYDIDLENQKGLVAPAGTPRERIKILHDALKRVCEHPAFIELAAKQKIEIGYLDPDAFGESLQSMYDQLEGVLNE